MFTIESDLAQLISEDECRHVLQQAGYDEGTFVKHEITKINGDLPGFLGEYLKLLIKTKNGSSYEFFVKSIPIFNEKKRQFIESSGIFKKEADLYKLLEQFNHEFGFKWKPRCFLTRLDLIVLEDLNLLDYETLPSRFNFTQKHVQLILRSLAALHSSCIIYELETGTVIGDDYKECLFEVSAMRESDWFITGLKALVEVALTATKFAGSKNANLIEEHFLNKLLEVTDHLDNCPPKFKKVVCHRDIWTKNFLFSRDSHENCVLIDFQIVRYQPPGEDLVMAATVLQRKKDVDKDFKENLNFYYETLREMLQKFSINVEQVLPMEHIVESCTYFKRLALVLKGVFLTMTHLPPGVLSKIHEVPENYHSFVNIDRASTTLKYIQEDECFRSWIIETVEELVEVVFGDDLDKIE